MVVDALDYGIVELFSREPGTSMVQAAKQLGVARPTVQARLAKLQASGALTGIIPVLDPAEFGYPITAMCRVLIEQRLGHDAFLRDIATIPEVLDLYTITGDFDVSMRVVAKSNADLQRVFDEISAIPSVTRTTSAIVLHSHLQDRTLQLFERACKEQH
ncbi:Lrp/AsnC family transcriptional regulator [Pseudoclavibacter alba]|uniref:Lrp/AsnC family transcriptional regulator n=1 Tax=Pseudoclavibacter albus TaxID=272241 RepID=A0ABT2HVV4_9MICO|nr:Lrp/AsnC family transcriptional regulator [Pseudoclavibacter alba]MBN6777677.1 Lrp/AsnC family transcriptional regulator [Pseudoclavibacter alba]MCT2042286.1 Lrp/AsnC family transcriptional regulator [Pseudoclavibacter alba]